MLVIAHRLRSVMDAGRIIVLCNGKVESTGTHVSLLEKSEVYRNMWKALESSENWLAGGDEHD